MAKENSERLYQNLAGRTKVADNKLHFEYNIEGKKSFDIYRLPFKIWLNRFWTGISGIQGEVFCSV